MSRTVTSVVVPVSSVPSADLGSAVADTLVALEASMRMGMDAVAALRVALAPISGRSVAVAAPVSESAQATVMASELGICGFPTKSGKPCQHVSGKCPVSSHKVPAKADKADKAPKAPKATETVTSAPKLGSKARSEWNRQASMAARLAGGSTYKTLVSAKVWARAQAARDAGMSARDFVATLVK